MKLFVKKLSTMMVLSVVLSCIFCLCGTLLAFHADLPIGATIALITGICYVIAPLTRARKRITSWFAEGYELSIYLRTPLLTMAKAIISSAIFKILPLSLSLNLGGYSFTGPYCATTASSMENRVHRVSSGYLWGASLACRYRCQDLL